MFNYLQLSLLAVYVQYISRFCLKSQLPVTHNLTELFVCRRYRRNFHELTISSMHLILLYDREVPACIGLPAINALLLLQMQM